MLARALATPSNLLVLDEPTNDLDLETLDLLQEAIADYPGTVILVSHDRDFLDRTVTSLLAAEGNGRWVEYAGGYSDMLAQRGGAGCPPAPQVEATRRRGQDRCAACARPSSETKARASARSTRSRRSRPHRDAPLRDRGACATELADPGALRARRRGLRKTAADLTQAEESLAKAEEEWLALEMLREEIEG